MNKNDVKIELESFTLKNKNSCEFIFLVSVDHDSGQYSKYRDYRRVEQTSILVGKERKLKPDVDLFELTILDLLQEAVEEMKKAFRDRIARGIRKNGYHIGLVTYQVFSQDQFFLDDSYINQ